MFERVKILIATLCGTMALAWIQPVHAQATVQSPSSPEKGAVQKILKVCLQCHGTGGISTIPSHPTIAGQKKDYIARQLTAFLQASETHQGKRNKDVDGPALSKSEARIGMRADPIMEHMVNGLEPTMIVKIASVVSKLACRKDDTVVHPPPPLPSIMKACVSCHGADGISHQYDVPNLAGQQRAYLRRKLLLIRESAWGAQPREGDSLRSHPIMESHVGRLKIEDVDALAKYYAALDCRGRTAK